MSTNQTLGKSFVPKPPIINLPATYMIALHSLLCFVTESCANINLPTPAVTSGKPLYVKAYEIVSTKNINIFVRLDGFHQLISFLGSIRCLGFLMESSRLQTALECVYVQLTVNSWSHVQWKSLRSCMWTCYMHWLFNLYFWKIFLASFTESQHAKLIETYESNNPDDHINDDVAIKLTDW